MSGIDWNGILRLPEAALAGCRRIPKTVLVKQAMLTKTEQKRLDKVARLEHFATVQKSTTRIPPYEDDERNVQSVVFLRCEMTAGTMAVAEVAEHFFYSGEYVSRLFKKYLNTTVANYVLQRRIVYSQRLIETDMPLLDVCYQAGFGSTSSFIRAFQSVTGMTPSKYRHAHHERLKPSGG